ncbi:hypothetical protein DLAC_00244 [Tieghemostelium lacteum]|uniref:Transmembrane protein n=1 Tax=Tieghemostelium lacteum TaxID=361077 RepID=A0A152A977_TIELA|nr:hypothetical protein DLAC_00244 [Tieghemostelium lacteum]|eukprot:KYR02782.1 hypothetical protein DLAC_00244 [Tieghemostelium lacteum]
MQGAGRYVGLGPRVSSSASESPFPETYTNWRELIYFRSWQATGIVPIIYYFSYIAAIIFFIAEIVTLSKEFGAGGFFLGLLYGTLELLAIILTTRVGCEIVMSIYDIRDNIYKMSAGVSVPSSNNNNQQAGTYQYQSVPSQSSQPSGGQDYQQQKYQEPYQGSL